MEGDLERREWLAEQLAHVLDTRGWLRFPKVGWPDWTGDELAERRRELFQTIEDLEAEGRPVAIVENDEVTVLAWADRD